MQFKNITKHYGNKVVLENFNLQVEPNQITCILGESGSGKTTLLQIAANLIPYQGECDCNDVSYIFQDARLLPNLTVNENLKFVLPKSEWDKIPNMLQKVGLLDKMQRYPLQLSGGEAKRVAIARAFLFPHKVLLMDEPFSSLDVRLKKELLDLVVTLWQQTHNTVLMVTHDVHEAVQVAHKAVVINHGKAVKEIPITTPLPRNYFEKLPQEDELLHSLFLTTDK